MAKRTKKTRRTDGISYRIFDDAWYSSVTGKYRSLKDEAGNVIHGKDSEEAAKRAYARLLLETADRGPDAPKTLYTVRQVCNAYLDYLNKRPSQKGYKLALGYLTAFASHVGPDTYAHKVQRSALLNLLEANTQWKSNNTIARVIGVVVATFNQAVERGWIEKNPFQNYKRPSLVARVTLISPEEEKLVFRFANRALADYCWFLRRTGCRPDEAARIEAANCRDNGTNVVVTLTEWKNADKSGKPRVIVCDSEISALVRHLCRINPVGPIFRNCEGLPLVESRRIAAWDALRDKIERNEPGKFNSELSLYSFRHTYITDQVRRGTPTTVIARLAGTSAKMIDRVYCHLSEEDLLGFVNGGAVAMAAG